MTIDLAADAESDDLSASAREFFQAWRRADMARITQLLAPDCEWYRDGEPIALTDDAVFRELDTAATASDITLQMINADDHGASALLMGETAGPNTARRPVGFINLKFDVDGIAKVSEARLSAPRRGAHVAQRPGAGAAVAGTGAKLVAIVLFCFLDELVFSMPVLAVAAIWGPWHAFVLLTPLYFAFAVIVGVVISRVRGRRGAASGSALQRWLDAKTARQETDWERRALLGFGFLGAGVVTIALGPILTPWLAHRLGLDRRYGTVVVGSVFWSTCLVGTYSGLIALIL
jgi:hypothetical protein